MNFYEHGKNFAELCVRKYGDNASFEDLWGELSRFGFFRLLDDEIEMSTKDIVSLMQGLGYGNGKIGALFSANVQLWACIKPLQKFDVNKSHNKVLTELVQGIKIGAHAITEEHSGSDVFSMNTMYKKVDDRYLINGSKCFITNAPIADVFLIYAKKENSNSISCFVIEKDTEGLVIGEKKPKMGMEMAPMGDILLENCIIPESCILGKEGQGRNVFHFTMLQERPFLLAFQIGIMKRQFDDCLRYVKEKKSGNSNIISFDSVANRIADMKVRLEISNAVLARTIEDKNDGINAYLNASIAKIVISENLFRNSLDAMKNYGTFGYLNGYNVAEQLADSLGALFYSGTSDIQKRIIAALV